MSFGHCWGSAIAGSLYQQPKEGSVIGPNNQIYFFSEEEVEGLLSAFFTDAGKVFSHFRAFNFSDLKVGYGCGKRYQRCIRRQGRPRESSGATDSTNTS